MSKESLGVINWWGFSPALDLFDNEFLMIDESTTDINVLLIGSGDCRHVLQTLSTMYKRPKRNININFYLIENALELYARQMLQLVIALMPLERIGLQDKTELFLELYGNGLVREQSMAFARQLADHFIRFVTDSQCYPALSQLFDIANLKFKERDILEAIFKLWKDSNTKLFDFSLCWDLRLRHNLGTRYDAIPNIFDWDCSMTLHDRGADIIKSREYSHWRHKGVAFQLRDANYDVSNRTLASGRVLQAGGGDKTVRIGYWGDIVCSPYISFGISSTNGAHLFQKSNNQYIYGAERVAEYNISEIFYQLAHGKQYKAEPNGNPVRSNVTITEVNEDIDQESSSHIDGDCQPFQYLNELIPMPNVKLIFLPVNSLVEYVSKKTKFESHFDLVYFSSSLIGQLESCPSFARLLRPEAKVLVEMPKYIVNINAEQIDRYRTRVDEMAKAQSLQISPESCAAGLNKSNHIVYNLNQ